MDLKILLAPAGYLLDNVSGSAESKLFELVNALARAGVEVYAIVGYLNLKTTQNIHPNLRFYTSLFRKQSKDSLGELMNRATFIYTTYRLGEKILKYADVLHHLSRLPVYGAGSFNLMALLNKHKPLPFVIGPIQPPQDPKVFGEVGTWLKTAKIMGDISLKITELTLKLSDKMLETLKVLTFKKADKVICINDVTKKLAQKYIEKEKLVVVPSGVDVNRFKPRYPSESIENVKLLSVGYLLKRKGFHLLIRAMKDVCKHYPKVTLKIVGDGPEFENLKKLLRKLRLENNVQLLGNVQYNKISSYYEEADIFINPTLHEAFSNVNLEAQASGKALITTHGHFISSNADRNTALFVKPGDINELSNAILKLIRDPDMMLRLAKNARTYVEKKYSWKVIAKKLILLYLELVENAGV